MARARGAKEPSTYKTRPQVPPELSTRFEVVRRVIASTTTITDAASELRMARVNMQALVHRVEAAMIAALQPRPTGPQPPSANEKALKQRVDQLQKQNAKLSKQLQAADDMMMAAGEIIRSLRGLPPSTASRTRGSRSSTQRSTPSVAAESGDEDPEPEPAASRIESALRRVLGRLATKTRGNARAAAVLGASTKTIRRWLRRLLGGEALIQRRGGRMKPGPPASEQRVREIVADLHGLAGAESLAHSVEGVSRRRAALLKRETLTELERTRKASCGTVTISEPGILRGFDAMYLDHGFALNAADGAVPYRTSSVHVPAYDADHVASVLALDFDVHGAPLVLRDDRARCHTAPAVTSVLRRHGVALLQGPAYHAQYYGQHERQNREHRAWLRGLGSPSHDMQPALDRMKTALNDTWRRPTLAWSSATEAWKARRCVDDERRSFLDEVTRRADCLRQRGLESALAMRLAIEQALTERGYLRITPGRHALCEQTI